MIESSFPYMILQKKRLNLYHKSPHGGYRNFIKNRTQLNQTGPIINLNGKILGQHRGIYLYTVGQRKGLGMSAPHPLYVIKIDPIQNSITVGEKKDLEAQALIADQVNLLVNHIPNEEVFGLTRYSNQVCPCILERKNNTIKVTFKRNLENITPGQSVVWYSHEGIVIGGGIIKEVIR